MADQFSPEELAAMREDARGARAEQQAPVETAADGTVGKALHGAPEAEQAVAPPEPPRAQPSSKETPRPARKRKRRGDKGRRIAALVEAARTAPIPEGKEPEAAAQPPSEAPPASEVAAEVPAAGELETPIETVTASGAAAPGEAAVPEEAAVSSEAAAAGDAGAGEEAAAPGEAVEGAGVGLGEVMPFQEAYAGAEADLEAAGVEELDIDDEAVEVTHDAAEEQQLLPSPLPAAAENWFETVFDDDYARIHAPPEPEQFDRELRFYVDALGVVPGARLLDLGCGSGIYAVELQARGFDMVGLDSSMPLLTRATEEARRRGLGPSFVHGDMRALSLEDEFDGILCVHGTFGYFDDARNAEVIATLHRALRPGGRLLLGVPNRDYFVSDLPARVCWEADGAMVLDEVDFDFLRGRLEVKRAIAVEDGRQVEHRYSIRAYCLHELTQLVEQAGFRVVSVSGHVATRNTFLGQYSRSILLVAERL